MFDPRRGHPTVPELVQDAFEPFFWLRTWLRSM